MNIDTSRKIC